jgi:hypothetical protein
VIRACDIVVISDYAKGFLSPPIAEAIIRRAHDAGLEVVVDPRPQNRECYRGCDYVTPNWKESLALLGWADADPSQEAAARSLGLSQPQTLRFVVLPQAVRRVIPPLLNDFIGLQKDTALVALIGPIEAFRQSQIDVAATFNYTPYLCTALLFVLLTIPLARLTDWLIARDRRRQLAGAV